MVNMFIFNREYVHLQKIRSIFSRCWQLQIFFNFHPEPWGKVSNLRSIFFQRGWFNHQPDKVHIFHYQRPCFRWKNPNRGQFCSHGRPSSTAWNRSYFRATSFWRTPRRRPGNLPIGKKKMLAWWFQSDLFGMVEWPFQRLSDLQLGDKMVTLNHLGVVVSNMGVSKNRGIYPKIDFVYNGISLFFNGWFGGGTDYFRKHPNLPMSHSAFFLCDRQDWWF